MLTRRAFQRSPFASANAQRKPHAPHEAGERDARCVRRRRRTHKDSPAVLWEASRPRVGPLPKILEASAQRRRRCPRPRSRRGTPTSILCQDFSSRARARDPQDDIRAPPLGTSDTPVLLKPISCFHYFPYSFFEKVTMLSHDNSNSKRFLQTNCVNSTPTWSFSGQKKKSDGQFLWNELTADYSSYR